MKTTTTAPEMTLDEMFAEIERIENDPEFIAGHAAAVDAEMKRAHDEFYAARERDAAIWEAVQMGVFD